MIKVNNLKFSYGSSVVLENISMDLQEGKIYGLLGENGVGKTTLLTLLCGLKKTQVGTINIDGANPYKRQPSLIENIIFLPDEINAYPVTADSYASLRGKLYKSYNHEKFTSIMKDFDNDSAQIMNRMSFGQLKKTHIAFGLACGTKYLFLDEPTNGLDIPSKAQFRKAITKYTSEESTIIISTHQVRDLENIIDPIIILDSKEVLLNATLEEISNKLYFNYSQDASYESLYSERLPGGFIQVSLNTSGEDSKVNIEALFNTVHNNKNLIKDLFRK